MWYLPWKPYIVQRYRYRFVEHILSHEIHKLYSHRSQLYDKSICMGGPWYKSAALLIVIHVYTQQ